MREDATPVNTVFFTRVRNEIHNNNDIRNIKWWFLPHSLRLEASVLSTSIPVIDSNKRFFLSRMFHRITPVNVSSNELEQTVIQYVSQNRLATPHRLLGRDIRQFFGDPIPRRSRSPLWEPARTPQKPPAPPPSFVIELLMKDATETNKTCPITMLPFSELQSIGLTTCFHLFELDSLQKWKDEHGNCPLCRAPVSSVHIWKRPSSDA